MLIAIHGVKLYAQCFTRSEAIRSLLNKERSDMFIAVHEVKQYAHFCTRSEALCSLLYKE